jgi:predicted DNA-binding mobile mystery protein A
MTSMVHANTNKLVLRRQMDAKVAEIRIPANALLPPVHGWVRAIRQALGMTLAHVGKRLAMAPKNVSDMERREALGTASIETLRRAADALNCDLVYFFVPKTSFSGCVELQAEKAARRVLQAVGHTMKLESQGVNRTEVEAQVQDMARAMARDTDSRMWDEP